MNNSLSTLNKTNSHNIDLSNQTITNFDFSVYQLLRFANFSDSILESCNLTDCTCSFADFTNATLINTNITGMLYNYAKLENCTFKDCLFEGDTINKLPSVLTVYRYDIVISDNNMRIGWVSKPITEWELVNKDSDIEDTILNLWLNNKQDILEMIKCHKNNINLDKIISKVVAKMKKSGK